MLAPEDMLAPPAAAMLLGISVSALERMRRNRKGPVWTKVTGEIGSPGGRIRYRRSDIEEYLQSRRVDPRVEQTFDDVPIPGLENSENVGGMISEPLRLDPT